ncbi:hypothetical protein LXL04_015084 [Taraxacum kok-saghyz]
MEKWFKIREKEKRFQCRHFFSKFSLNCRRKVAENQPLLNDHQEDDEELQNQQYLIAAEKNSSRRIASLDVFLGLSIFLLSQPTKYSLMLLLITYFSSRGYLHGITSLIYGAHIEKIRLFGILQRIVIGYIAAAVCEIWLPRQTSKKEPFFRVYIWHRCAVILLSAIYMGLTYGLYVADWQFKDLYSLSSLISENGTTIHNVRCSNRGDLGPGCNAAGMIDRYVLGIHHLYLYQKPTYRNLEVFLYAFQLLLMNVVYLTEAKFQILHLLGAMPLFEPEGILSLWLFQMPSTSISSTSTVNQRR